LPGEPGSLPSLPDPFGSAPLADRARAYLHTNCAGCHRPGGPTPSSMDWRYETPLGQTGSCNVPASSGSALGIQDARLLAPGDPQRSLIWQRMGRRDVHAMPPVGSLQVDTAGLSLLQDWINSLGSCD
jgi:mono/diheme cytochrome c family protein